MPGLLVPAIEREGNSLKGFNKFHPKNEQARTKFWSWLCNSVPRRSTADMELTGVRRSCLWSDGVGPSYFRKLDFQVPLALILGYCSTDCLSAQLPGVRRRRARCRPPYGNIHPTPCTLHPTHCTVHPAPCTLHPTPYLHPAPYTLHRGGSHERGTPVVERMHTAGPGLDVAPTGPSRPESMAF